MHIDFKKIEWLVDKKKERDLKVKKEIIYCLLNFFFTSFGKQIDLMSTGINHIFEANAFIAFFSLEVLFLNIVYSLEKEKICKS